MSSDSERELRDQQRAKCLFLKLVCVLVPGAFHDDSFRRLIEEATRVVSEADSDEFLSRAGGLSDTLDKLVVHSTSYLRAKVSIEQIAKEFARLLSDRGQEVYSTGVTFGWLDRLIDCAPLGLRGDLPYHARVGLAVHAGQASVEEAFLLHDAFFLLDIADICHEKLLMAAPEFSEVRSTDRSYLTISTGNQNVGSAARLCVFSFYAFVEAFVNSVGRDFAERELADLSPADLETLHGRKRGRYLSLERKMESFPTIIRQDKNPPIVLTDKKQQREPFLTFFSGIREVRDASTHFGVGKASIWRGPEEWLDFAESTSTVSVEVASEFWGACYPGRDKPAYLLGLDRRALRGFARERVAITKRILGGTKE